MTKRNGIKTWPQVITRLLCGILTIRLGLPSWLVWVWGTLCGFITPLSNSAIPAVTRLYVLLGLWCLLRLVAEALQDVASRTD